MANVTKPLREQVCEVLRQIESGQLRVVNLNASSYVDTYSGFSSMSDVRMLDKTMISGYRIKLEIELVAGDAGTANTEPKSEPKLPARPFGARELDL